MIVDHTARNTDTDLQYEAVYRVAQANGRVTVNHRFFGSRDQAERFLGTVAHCPPVR